jgi:gag-polypeptide of LTR copia-type
MADVDPEAAIKSSLTTIRVLIFDGSPGASDQLSFDEWREKFLYLSPSCDEFLSLIALSGNIPAGKRDINIKLYRHVLLNTNGLASSIVRQHHNDGRTAVAALDDKFGAIDEARIQHHLEALNNISLKKDQDIDQFILDARFHSNELERCGVKLTDAGVKVFILQHLPEEYENVRDTLRSNPKCTMEELTRTLRTRYDFLQQKAPGRSHHSDIFGPGGSAALYAAVNRDRRGDPRASAGAGATGKYCPLHPMGTHDMKECKNIIDMVDKEKVRRNNSTGKVPCPRHPLARHSRDDCIYLKNNPHEASALLTGVVGTNTYINATHRPIAL